MADELFEFRWYVDEGGYNWLRVPWQEKFLIGAWRELELFLTSGVPEGVERPVHWYYPLHQHTGLFRHFAGIEISKDSIQKFANTYGLLGGNLSKSILLPLKDSVQIPPGKGRKPKRRGTLGIGETARSWVDEISEMRRALMFWDLVAAKDRKRLSQHVHWVRPDAVRIDFESGSSWIATPEIRSYRLDQIPKGDVIRPTLFYIQEIINKHVEGRVSPRLLWDTQRQQMSMHIVPNSLIGALWLQFARAVDGEKKYERCLECKTWFEVSLEAARTNRKYCKDACRFKAYRQRQNEARRLHIMGLSIKEIAKRLDSDIATVKSWIARSQS